MISFESLCAALPSLSGDAVKVALVLMLVPREATELCVDLSWRTRTARELFVHVKIVERSLKELSDAQLCELQRVTLKRLNALPMSEGSPSLARTPSMSEANGGAGSEATSRGREPQDLEEGNAAKVASVPESGADVAASARSRRSGAARTAAVADQPPTSAAVQACIACFDALYRDVNSGAKPTWGARQYVQVKTLVDKHGQAEVEKRIKIMFTAPPRFPAPPYDLSTFVQHFDKFAQPSGKGGMIDRWSSGESYYGGGS